MLYFIRMILISLWIMFTCLLGIICGIFRPFDFRLTRFWANLIAFGHHFLGLKLTILNKELLADKGPGIYISNHQHNLDIFPGGYVLPKNTVTLGKRSILWVPFFGIFYWLSGNILINRKDKQSAFTTLDEVADAITSKGLSLWIMPEGTRSKGKGLLPFKAGAFITAVKAQVPITPIVFSSYVNTVNLNKWHSGDIYIKILPSISTVGLTLEDVRVLKRQAHKLIKEELVKLDLFALEQKEKNE